MEAVRFVPDSAPLPPGTVAKAPPVSSKSLKRTTGTLPTLVKVLEKKPSEAAPQPAAMDKGSKPPSTAELPDDPDGGESKPSFFKSITAKIGALFKSSPPTEPEPEAPETKPEMAVISEKKPEVEEKKLKTEEATVIQERQELRDKLAAKEKAEPVKKPELKKSVTVEEPKPLLGLKTLPPLPENENKGEESKEKKTVFESDDELFEKEQPVVLKKSKKLSRVVIFALVGLVLAAGLACGAYLYVQSSHQAAASLWEALKGGDQDQLQKLVDFPSVRKTLADQVAAQAANSGTQDADSRTAIQEMIRNSINYYVTPDAISALATKGALPPAGPDATVTPALATDIFSKLIALPVKSQGMVAYDHYVIDLDAAKLDLIFAGAAWKLNQIELNAEFKLPEAPGSQAPPTNLGASLTQPVIETYFDDGKAKFEKQDWSGAIADFDRVLAMDPKQVVALNNRGMARMAKGDMEGAIADFNQVISLNPTFAEAYDSRGDAKTAQKDIEGAIADYSQAINLNPKLADAFYKRGTSRTIKGDYEGAIADFTQDITLDPTNAKAFSNRGYVRKAQKDLDGAIADFTQALAIDPKIVGAYFNRGSAKYEKADLDGAIADFNRALDLDPKMTRGYYSRGIAKNTKNDLDGAIADYNQALSLDPNLVPALNDRALVRQARGDLKGALDDYNRALTLDPKLGNAYYARGLIKEQLNDLDGAIADSSRSLDIDPKRAQAFYNRGFAKLVKGNLEGAKSDLQKFCELASKDPYADHARLYLWLIQMAQSPTNTANQDLSDALQNNWSLAPDDLVTKIAQFLLDRETEADLIASAASPDAQKDSGHHCEVWYFVGMKRLLAGDKATAIDYFHKCLATGQKDYCEYILAQAELQILAPNP